MQVRGERFGVFVGSLVKGVWWEGIVFDEGFGGFLAFAFEELDEFKILVNKVLFVMALVAVGVHEGSFLNE